VYILSRGEADFALSPHAITTRRMTPRRVRLHLHQRYYPGEWKGPRAITTVCLADVESVGQLSSSVTVTHSLAVMIPLAYSSVWCSPCPCRACSFTLTGVILSSNYLSIERCVKMDTMHAWSLSAVCLNLPLFGRSAVGEPESTFSTGLVERKAE